jgi:cell division initiation protein
MRLTPVEILHQKFNRSFRGYNEEEVDVFLERVHAGYEALYRENGDLKEKLENMTSQLNSYRELEESLKNTMLMAQKNAEELLSNKQKEAELIMKDASFESEKLVAEAQEQARKLKEEFAHLRHQKELFIMEYRTLLKSHLAFLEEGAFPPSPSPT